MYDQCVVELALVLDLLDHSPDFIIGIGGVSREHLRLTREQFLAQTKGHLLTSATIGGLFAREYQ